MRRSPLIAVGEKHACTGCGAVYGHGAGKPRNGFCAGCWRRLLVTQKMNAGAMMASDESERRIRVLESALTACAAREAVLVGALVGVESFDAAIDFEENRGEIIGIARAALANPSPAATALLAVVEAARRVNQVSGEATKAYPDQEKLSLFYVALCDLHDRFATLDAAIGRK